MPCSFVDKTPDFRANLFPSSSGFSDISSVLKMDAAGLSKTVTTSPEDHNVCSWVKQSKAVLVYAMKAYKGDKASCILKLSTRWRKVASLMHELLYPGERAPIIH
jgi:hypothetical protein